MIMYNLIWSNFNFVINTVLGNHMQFRHVYTYTFACLLFTIIETTFENFLSAGFTIINFGEHILNMNKGAKFLKKLWCCVGGSITR